MENKELSVADKMFKKLGFEVYSNIKNLIKKNDWFITQDDVYMIYEKIEETEKSRILRRFTIGLPELNVRLETYINYQRVDLTYLSKEEVIALNTKIQELEEFLKEVE